jgi:hypothetical protein
MTQTATTQKPSQQTSRARVYQAAAGEWSWTIALDGEFVARGAGFESGEAAEDDLYEHLQRPYSLILEHDPDSGVIYGPVLEDAPEKPSQKKSVVELERDIGDLRHALRMAEGLVSRELPMVAQVGAGTKNPSCLSPVYENLSSAVRIIEGALK